MPWSARDGVLPSYRGRTKCHLPNAVSGVLRCRDRPLPGSPSQHHRPGVPTQRRSRGTLRFRHRRDLGPLPQACPPAAAQDRPSPLDGVCRRAAGRTLVGPAARGLGGSFPQPYHHLSLDLGRSRANPPVPSLPADRPPCCSTTRLAKASPSPVPPRSIARALSAL